MHKKNTISRPSRLKHFAQKNLYGKIYPSLISHEIPENFLTTDGYTKKNLIRDIYKLIDCNKKMSFVNKTVVQKKSIGLPGQDDFEVKHVKKIELFDVNHCNIFALCPVCAEKVSRRRREKYKSEIMNLAEKYDYSYMINFTTRNSDSFKESYNRLREAIRKYVLMGQMRGIKSNGEKIRSGGEASKIKAMALSIEVKKGKNRNQWHVHGHAIAFCDQRVDYQIYNADKKHEIITECKTKNGHSPSRDDLKAAILESGTIELVNEDGEIYEREIPVSKASKEWLSATGGTSANIKFIPLKGSPEKIYKQCVEVIKYTSKVSSLSKDDILEILIHRKGKRYFSTYGELYNKINPRCKEDESVLYVEGVTGYVWSAGKGEMISMTKDDREKVARKYENRETVYRVQGIIMQAYYEKEKVLASIMKEAVSHKEKNPKTWPEYKLHVIKLIDDLENAYHYSKRQIYNNLMKTTHKLPRFHNTPIQKMYQKTIDKLLKVA